MIFHSEGSNMRVNIILSLALILSTSRTAGQFTYYGNNACTTQNNRQGRCINIRSCPHLVNLLLRKPVSHQIIDFLRKSNCGYEDKDPKVCCEDDLAQQSVIQSSTPLPNRANYSGLHRLNDDNCGVISTNVAIPVAVGSVPAKINEFPWMALLVYDVGKGSPGFLCGGSIINKRYVLTAAHCVTNLPSGKRLTGVRVGEYNTNTDKDCSAGSCNAEYQEFTVEDVVSHTGFSKNTLHNDIALIRLGGDIKFIPNNVQTICLPVGPTVIPNKLTVSGWGVYDDLRQRSSVIRKVELPRYSQDQCINVYKSKNIAIWHKQICAGGMQGVDGCEGDSGGPLQAKQFYNNANRILQYGIVSFGTKKCGVQDIPGVYTRVDSYLDWILQNMRDIPQEDYEEEIDDDYPV